jgi:hypothetical protein
MKIWPALLVLSALLGCGPGDEAQTSNETPLPSGVEMVALDLSTVDGIDSVEQRAASSLPVVAAERTVVCDDMNSNQRFLSRTFTVTNNTGQALSQLHAHAHTQPGNSDGTALKDLMAFGAVKPANAQQALPRHGMLCEAQQRPVPDAQRADLQLYTPAYLAAETQQVPNLPNGVLALGYGFLAQQRADNANADDDPRTIGPGESAQFTVAYKVPRGSDAVYQLKATFVLYSGGAANELVQTPEDQRNGTTAGLTTLPADTARVSVAGGPACGLSAGHRFQSAVLIGKRADQDITDSELDAPATFTTINSPNADGPGSLREAIANAPTGGAICFTQNIPAIGLTIERDLTLMGTQGAALNGQNSFQVLHITGAKVQLYGFRIYNGSSNTGAGIHNTSTLTLRGMRIDSNIAGASDMAQGGGIYSSGPLFIFDSVVQQNTAIGHDGGVSHPDFYAASGGAAQGGGIYLDNAPLQLVGSLVSGNTAQGGNGAMGRNGQEEIQGTEEPVFAFCTVSPTDGGNGGDAYGGGIYKAGTSTVVNPSLVAGNVTVGGNPGSGGDVPDTCSIYGSNLGSFGNAGPEDIAP